jgi:hypothetical protein
MPEQAEDEEGRLLSVGSVTDPSSWLVTTQEPSTNEDNIDVDLSSSLTSEVSAVLPGES